MSLASAPVRARATPSTCTRRRGGGKVRSRVVTRAMGMKENDDDARVRRGERANAAATAMLTAAMTLSAAGAAHAGVKEVEDYLIAFWHFRTADTTSVLLYTVAPIMVPYGIFSILIGKKKEQQLAELEKGGWLAFMKERELNAEMLELPQLNAFVKAADAGVLDDAMVTEFVRKLKVSEQWKKSTIAIEDNRAEEAKKRARAEAIIEAKKARGDFEKTKSR